MLRDLGETRPRCSYWNSGSARSTRFSFRVLLLLFRKFRVTLAFAEKSWHIAEMLLRAERGCGLSRTVTLAWMDGTPLVIPHCFLSPFSHCTTEQQHWGRERDPAREANFTLRFANFSLAPAPPPPFLPYHDRYPISIYALHLLASMAGEISKLVERRCHQRSCLSYARLLTELATCKNGNSVLYLLQSNLSLKLILYLWRIIFGPFPVLLQCIIK